MIYFRFCRQFHVGRNLENTCTPRQLANAMNKMLGVRAKTAPQKDIPFTVKPDKFIKGTEVKKHPSSRRSQVLNKIFMRYITEIMATGEYSSEIIGHGIEINRVKIAPDFKILNVFWVSRDNDNVDKIEKVLENNAGYLKSELSKLRVMGVVPNIHFVKDKHYAHIVDINKRLAQADFGEDYVPIDPLSKLKSELELSISLDDVTKQKIQEVEKSTDETFEDPLPAMTSNIFNVNHSDIMNRVKKSLKKSEALHRNSSTGSEYSKWLDFKRTQTENENPICLGNERSKQEAFRKFLQQRELLRQKAGKKKNENVSLEYLKSEQAESCFKYMYEHENEEEDYLIDEVDEK